MIERASPSDRAFLAMDTGQVPEQFGVILMLAEADAMELARARRLIAERIQAVPAQELDAQPTASTSPRVGS